MTPGSKLSSREMDAAVYHLVRAGGGAFTSNGLWWEGMGHEHAPYFVPRKGDVNYPGMVTVDDVRKSLMRLKRSGLVQSWVARGRQRGDLGCWGKQVNAKHWISYPDLVREAKRLGYFDDVGAMPPPPRTSSPSPPAAWGPQWIITRGNDAPRQEDLDLDPDPPPAPRKFKKLRARSRIVKKRAVRRVRR